MDLERTSVVIRPRTPWEAVDLGFRMARTWWRSLLGPWLAVTVPPWAVAFVVFHRRPWIALLVLWWLRPLFDRVPLFVLSRAVFGAPPTARETVRALPGLLWPNLFAALLLRIAPVRSFHLPVWQLEGANRERRERFRVLDLEGRSEAARLTLVCLWMELCLFAGGLGLIALAIPGVGVEEVWEWAGAGLAGTSAPGLAVVAVTSLVAHTLIEPCYVAAGFSLYLRARTRLEGWDVELGLRRLAARLGRLRGAAGVVLLALLPLAAPLGALPARPAAAQEAAPLETEEDGGEPVDPAEAIRQVLAEPEFSSRREVTRWEPRPWLEDLRFSGRRPRATSSVSGPAGLGSAVAVVMAVALVVWVLWQVWVLVRGMRLRPAIGASGDARTPLPEPETGRTPLRVALPPDAGHAAWELWSRGDRVEALSLLYRGALDRLARAGGVPVDGSWTEGEVLRAVDRVLPGDGRSYLRRLTGAWTAAAYAHRLPADDEVRALCDGWGRHLAEPAGEAAA